MAGIKSCFSLCASQSAAQKLVDLVCYRTRFLSHSPVDKFADHDFSVHGIRLSMPGLGFSGRGDGGLEVRIASTIGLQCRQRLLKVLLNVSSPC
jgi:hypothetical protein